MLNKANDWIKVTHVAGYHIYKTFETHHTATTTNNKDLPQQKTSTLNIQQRSVHTTQEHKLLKQGLQAADAEDKCGIRNLVPCHS